MRSRVCGGYIFILSLRAMAPAMRVGFALSEGGGWKAEASVFAKILLFCARARRFCAGDIYVCKSMRQLRRRRGGPFVFYVRGVVRREKYGGLRRAPHKCNISISSYPLEHLAPPACRGKNAHDECPPYRRVRTEYSVVL